MIRRVLQAATRLGVTSSALPSHDSKWTRVQNKNAIQSVRPLSQIWWFVIMTVLGVLTLFGQMVSLWPFSVKGRDFSLPNASWSAEMRKVYDHYAALCEEEEEGEDDAGGEKRKRPLWRKMPSYNRSIKYATGGVYLSKIIQSKARLFTRNIKEPGAAFEYAEFFNKQEKRSVCVFQAGHLLEGPPGHVHGGAIATMIDSETGSLAAYLSGPVMTANLNINYRSPIPLGSVVLLHSAVDQVEGRKIFVTCKVTSTDETKLHTEATALFLSINMGHLFGAKV